jgi:hypothetical protein
MRPHVSKLRSMSDNGPDAVEALDNPTEQRVRKWLRENGVDLEMRSVVYSARH